MKYAIWGKLEGRNWEIIDTASSEKEAFELLREYVLAFGSGWKYKIKKESTTRNKEEKI